MKSFIPKDGVLVLQVPGELTKSRKGTATAQALYCQESPGTCFSKIWSQATAQQGSLEVRADGMVWNVLAWIKVLAMPLRDVIP